MKCLVIGGAGFIGSQVSSLLVETGRDVLVLDRYPRFPRALPRNATYLMGDYSDRVLLRMLLIDVDEVINLAYATVPKTSSEDPLFDVLSNLPPNVALMQEVAEANLKKMVYISSGGTVYGKADLLPIDETHPTNPISSYGITKLAIEKYVEMFASINSLPAAIARPANAYGEDQAAFTGQGFIATAIQSIIQGKKIDMYGEQGTIRDYVHASDIARGILAILEHGEAGQAYNIGSGVGRNNRQILDIIEPLALRAGLKIEVNVLPERAFDVPANVLNSQKLHSVSGWQPLIPFEEGIQCVWDRLLSKANSR